MKWLDNRKRLNKRSEVAVCGLVPHTARGHGASRRRRGGRAPSRDVEHVGHRGLIAVVSPTVRNPWGIRREREAEKGGWVGHPPDRVMRWLGEPAKAGIIVGLANVRCRSD